MRTLVKNRRSFYYANYEGSIDTKDKDEFFTGEKDPGYGDPVLYTKGTVSSASGYSGIESFGDLADYDRVIVTGDMNCPINEQSILWIDETDPSKPHDYVVRRVAKTIDVIAIAVSSVKVSKNAVQG